MRVNDTIALARKRVKKDREVKEINKEYEQTEKLKASWMDRIQVKPEDSSLLRIRKTIFGTITEIEYNKLAKIIAIVMAFIIMGSVLEFVLETMYVLNNNEAQQAAFVGFELFFNVVFSVDYFAKILFFPYLSKLPSFLIKPFWIIDLLSILPFYIDMIFSNSSNASILRIVRIVRIFRIFRLLKASKNMKQVQLVFKALIRSREAIGLLIFLLLNGLFLFGSFVYFAEAGIADVDPVTKYLVYSSGPLSGTISTFQSIPHTMWWAIVTLTTVGYGDMYPTSGLGKSLGGLTMFAGLLVIAFPITILSINMSELYEEHKNQKALKLPHVESNEQVEKINKAITLVVEEHEEIRVAIQGLLGKKDIKLPSRSVVLNEPEPIKEEPALA